MSIRELTGALTVGQQQPAMKVPQPETIDVSILLGIARLTTVCLLNHACAATRFLVVKLGRCFFLLSFRNVIYLRILDPKHEGRQSHCDSVEVAPDARR